MQLRVDQFQGMATQPDADSVGCRFAKNVVFGSGRTWISVRPGTEQMTRMKRPGTASGQPIGAMQVYVIRDDRYGGLILAGGYTEPTNQLPTGGGLYFWPGIPATITSPEGSPIPAPGQLILCVNAKPTS